MAQTVLILGQSGRFGRNAKEAFHAAGWDVKGFDRRTDNLTRAAIGADVIVNAWNPPYPDWADQVPRLHAQVRAAAKAAGSTVILPGNVYVFGPEVPYPWSQDSPHRATNPLGRLRIEMEDAYAQDGVKTIVLRAGDFIDTERSGNWFDRVMINSLDKRRFVYPGDPDIPHAWAFLPDLAQAAVMLAEKRHSLSDFADIPFPGHTMTGAFIAEQLQTVLGQQVQLRRMNWLPLQIAKPVWPMARCLLEMRYLWNTPHSLDDSVFSSLLPDFDPTPVEEVLQRAIGITPSVPHKHVNPDQSVSARA